MREFRAEVVDIREEGLTGGRRRWRVLLTRTLFSSAEACGMLVAVSPSGARLEVPVLAVVEDGGDQWHVVEKPLGAGTGITGQVFGAEAQRG